MRRLPTIKILVASCMLTTVGLLGFGFSAPAQALEVATLKSADITAYNEAVEGFKAAMPASTTVCREYGG